jgi:hypothetical protein
MQCFFLGLLPIDDHDPGNNWSDLVFFDLKTTSSWNHSANQMALLKDID